MFLLIINHYGLMIIKTRNISLEGLRSETIIQCFLPLTNQLINLK